MTTMILTVMALLVLAAIQTVGAGEARSAARQPTVKHADLRTPGDVQHLAQSGRSARVFAHVARLP